MNRHIAILFQILLGCGSAFSQVNLDQGLVVRYQFNNSLDDSGPNGYTLMQSGGISFDYDRLGEPNSACVFSSANPDYLTGSSSAVCNPGEVTLSAWVNLSDVGTDQKIAGKAAVNSGGYLMGVQSGKLDAEIWDQTGAHIRLQGGAISQDEWTHLAISCKASDFLRIYVNGQLVDSLPSLANSVGSTFNMFTIGGAPWEPSALNADGLIDDVCLYNRKLSNLEIRALFQFTTGTKPREKTGTLSVAPIPATAGKINLQFPTIQNRRIRLWNSSGTLLTDVDSDNLTTQLDLQNCAAGLYSLSVTTDGISERRKILVE